MSFLRAKCMPRLQRFENNIKLQWLMQDGATSNTRKWLSTTFLKTSPNMCSENTLKRGILVEQDPYSPSLNQLDFFLWKLDNRRECRRIFKETCKAVFFKLERKSKPEKAIEGLSLFFHRYSKVPL